jgi:hypothetical protein
MNARQTTVLREGLLQPWVIYLTCLELRVRMQPTLAGSNSKG